MSDQEKVHIKLGLSGTYWDKRPSFRISFNDTTLLESSISAASDEVEYFEFDVDYATDEGTIKVEFLNKNPEDTKKDNYDDPVNFNIIGDLLLNVVSLEVDEIALNMIPFYKGKYVTNEPVLFNGEETNVITNCMNLGWNGAWSLTWTNPFYLWLLENM